MVQVHSLPPVSSKASDGEIHLLVQKIKRPFSHHPRVANLPVFGCFLIGDAKNLIKITPLLIEIPFFLEQSDFWTYYVLICSCSLIILGWASAHPTNQPNLSLKLCCFCVTNLSTSLGKPEANGCDTGTRHYQVKSSQRHDSRSDTARRLILLKLRPDTLC